MSWTNYIPQDIQDLYEVHEYHHASVILAKEFPNEFDDICSALRGFKLTEADVKKKGGSESDIPKNFSRILRPLGWTEEKLVASLVLGDVNADKNNAGKRIEQVVRSDTHKVDYIKGRVALDLEWNSKDQTYDRDLFAFRTFFDFNKISVAVLITRSVELESWFGELGKDIKAKYGASTTHMGKLLPRLRAGRHGGCPILAFGITRKVVQQ